MHKFKQILEINVLRECDKIHLRYLLNKISEKAFRVKGKIKNFTWKEIFYTNIHSLNNE